MVPSRKVSMVAPWANQVAPPCTTMPNGLFVPGGGV